MQHFFAKRWDFTLTFEALTDIHVGTGELSHKEINEELREVLVHAKCKDDKAYLPSASTKGALRATAVKAGLNAEMLFGSTDVGSAGAGRLVVFGATLSQIATAKDAPDFSTVSGTYIRPQHARNRHTRTVEPKYLYHSENTPKGTRFKLDAIYFEPATGGDPTDILLPLLNQLAALQGFSLGGQKTTLGQMRLVDDTVKLNKREIKRTMEENDGRTTIIVSLETCTLDISIDPAADSNCLDIHAPGPLLIADPTRLDERIETRKKIRTLQHKQGELAGWERALRQSLRSLSGYLETTLDWEARNRIDDPFISYAHKGFAGLCSTQRLFGVEGYRGLLSLHVFAATHEDEMTFPGLELDSLTQGALDSAAFAITAPVSGVMSLSISLDSTRYKRLLKTVQAGDQGKITKQDNNLLKRLNIRVSRHGLKAGAKVSRGYGWFSKFDMNLSMGMDDGE